MFLAGIQAKLELDPRLKHSGVTNGVTCTVFSRFSPDDRPNVTNGVFPCQAAFPKLRSFVTLVDLHGDKVFHHGVDGWSFSVERMIRLRAERLLDTFRLAWIYHDGISLLDEKP
jgi:hypothetical protein